MPTQPQQPEERGQAPDFEQPPVSDRDFKEAETALGGSKPETGGRPFMNSFMEHLVRTGTISEEIALKAAAWKRNHVRDRRSMLEVLKEEFNIAGEAVNAQVAQFYAFRIIDPHERVTRRLLPAEIQKLLKSLPEQIQQMAMRHKVLPYDVAENQPEKIIVVTPNPADREIVDFARALPFKRSEICYMSEQDWMDFWHRVTLEDGQPEPLSAEPAPPEAEMGDSEFAMDRIIARGQLLSTVDNVLADGVRVGASDIHFVPRGGRTTDILFRIDGELTRWYSIEDTRPDAVITALKSRCTDIDRNERAAAQEGAILRASEKVRFTVSVLPVTSRDSSGRIETAVLHIEQTAPPLPELGDLGLGKKGLALIDEALSGGAGLILITGPAGSGRTTTMHAIMRQIIRPTVNIISVERPVELLLDGVRQVRLGPKLSYDEAVQRILKHDPDVVVLGDVRSHESMQVSVRLAASGCLVLGVMEAYDTIGAFQRIYQSGVEPYLLGQSLRLCHAQRLVRRICDRCRERDTMDRREQLARLGFPEEEAAAVTLYRAIGCISCVGGFRGRAVVTETLLCDSELRELVAASMRGLDTHALAALAVQKGMDPLMLSARKMLQRGKTTLGELLRALS